MATETSVATTAPTGLITLIRTFNRCDTHQVGVLNQRFLGSPRA